MNCDDLANQLGFHCATLKGGGLVLTTPHTMPNGASIPVFVEPHNDGGFRLWDAGELLYEVIASGVRVDNRRSLSGLIRNVERYGAKLGADGVLELIAPATDLPAAFSSFLQAAFEVARWHRGALERAPYQDSLVDETIRLLSAAYPEASVERDVEIAGFSSQIWTFDVRQRGRLIDCIAAHPTAGSFEVKKLVDVRGSSSYQSADILVIVDDRADPERADQEMKIISQLADAQPFTALCRSLGGFATMH